MPNGAVLANHKGFQPPVLVSPDGQVISLSNPRWRRPQIVPLASKGQDVDLPRIPQSAIVPQRQSFKPVIEIDCCIEPNNSDRWPSAFFCMTGLERSRSVGGSGA